jgi:hypothetical protein
MSRRTPPYAKGIRVVLGDEWVGMLEERGWSHIAFIDALNAMDEDAIALAHPTNWMTEDEVENMERWKSF